MGSLCPLWTLRADLTSDLRLEGAGGGAQPWACASALYLPRARYSLSFSPVT